MKPYTILILVLLNASFCFSQTTLKGKVTFEGKPLVGCAITNKTKSINGQTVKALTNKSGSYEIQAAIGDSIAFAFVGFKNYEVAVNSLDELNVEMKPTETSLNEVTVVGWSSSSVSTRNFWVGAKIGYNFIGNADDNFFVGSATIALNLLDNNDNHHTFGVIGNIGNFKFNKDTNDTKNIQKVAQSINGLSVGLGYTHETSVRGPEKYKSNQYPTSYFREFLQTGVRLTTFTKVGKDSSTVNLAQSVTTAGLEFEQSGFKNGGSITMSAGLSLYIFDKNVYKKIFDEQKSKLITLDFTAILPISKNMGFFVNGTFTKKTSPAYILGIVFKP